MNASRYGGDKGVRTLTCTEQFRGMAFAPLTYRESLRDIEVRLSVFPWAHFRTTKAAVKMHTPQDLRGSIPSFIHVSDGNLHDVHALDLLMPEPGALYVVDHGYVDFRRLRCFLCDAVYVLFAIVKSKRVALPPC